MSEVGIGFVCGGATVSLASLAGRRTVFAWLHYRAGHHFWASPSTVVCECGESITAESTWMRVPLIVHADHLLSRVPS